MNSDRIYICGGFNGVNCMSSAEFYCGDTNQWTIIHPMGSQRSGCGVISFENYIYAIGGFNGSERLKSGERYDPRTNRWTPIAEMATMRSNFAIEVGQLFLVGLKQNMTLIIRFYLI